ncbi:fibronectin type III domain-containing protein [Thermaurantimonas aggregans]|nr:fibronectin type III domain-containing protein [Thermaurantimonas aggregans]
MAKNYLIKSALAFLMSVVVWQVSLLAQTTPTTAAGYFYQTNTSGNLGLDRNNNVIDMTTGVTVHIAGPAPATGTGSNAVGIPFPIPFEILGQVVTNFSVATNGIIGLNFNAISGNNIGGGTGIRVGAFVTGLNNGGLHSTGSISSKVVGTAPNRCFVIQWTGVTINNTSTTADGTWQARFYEGSNLMEFVLGPISLGAGSLTAAKSGFSNNSTAGNYYVVNFTDHTASTTTNHNNAFSTLGPIAALAGGGTPTTRRVYLFSPAPFVNQTFTSAANAQVTNPVAQGASNQPVIRLTVTTSGLNNPLTVSSITASANGTTSLSDISNARIYFTGTNPNFSTTFQVGSTIATPSTNMVFTPSTPIQLFHGSNYFWLTYDVSPTAQVNNVIDGEISSVVVGGNPQTPSPVAPAGNRLIQAPLSGTYTVGTSGQFATLADAISAVNSVGLSGNVTLNIISDQTLTAPVQINTWPEIGAGNYTLTIAPSGGVRTIEGTINNTGVIVITASRVTIDGRINGAGNNLIIRNNSTQTSAGVLVSVPSAAGLNQVTVRNCHLIGGPTLGLTTSTSGIQVQTQAAFPGANNVQILNNIIEGFYVGVNVNPSAGTLPSTGLEIVNNTIGVENPVDSNRLIGFRGIWVLNASSPLITDNKVNNIISYLGINIAGIFVGTGTSNCRIYRNSIKTVQNLNTGGWGAYGINCEAGNDHEVINNEITNVRTVNYFIGTTFNAFGIRFNVGTNHKVYFNSVNLTGNYDNTNQTTAVSACLLVVSSSTVVDVKNNNFVNQHSSNATGAKEFIAMWFPSGYNFASNLFSNHNNLFPPATNGFVAKVGTTANVGNYTTLSDFQSFSNKDTNSISANPLFNSNLVLIPTNPALNNVGTPISTVTNDITGAPRNATTPDIGCYEFTPTQPCFPPSNITVSNITSNSASVGWTPGANSPNDTLFQVSWGPIGFTPGSNPTTIALWNFNGASTTTIPGGTTSPSPAQGSGTASLVGGTTASFASGLVGGGSSDPVTTVPPNYGWNVSNFPVQGTGNKTAGIQINVSTVGLSNIVLQFDQRHSNTSANTVVVQYTTDVTASNPTWVDFQTFTAPAGDTWYNKRTVNFSSVSALNNNPNVGFRIVSAFAGTGNTYEASNSTSTYGPTGTWRFDMIIVTGSASGTGTTVTTSSNPFTITGLLPSTTYQVYVRSLCDTNSSAWAGPVDFTTLFQCPANAVCQTYSAGAINTMLNASPGPNDTSACPGVMQITIPAGNIIAGIDVQYTMVAQGGGWLSEQRSRLFSPTLNAGESMVLGPAVTSGGTHTYNRTNLSFANGASGTVTFQLHAIRTWGGSGTGLATCDTVYQYVPNNSWRLIVYYQPAPTCPTVTGLTVGTITANSVALSWNAATGATGYKVEYGVTGFTPGTGQTTTVTGTNTVITGLTPQTTYQFYVRTLCGTDSSANQAGPVSATTLCAIQNIPFTETFDSASTSLSCWTAAPQFQLVNVGGYGQPGNSIRFPFYNISGGSYDAISPQFQSVPSNYQLKFDHAYATYINEVDSLKISYSTDGGATYTTLVSLAGGVNGPLVTAPPISSSFTPTASQWGTYTIALPAGTNKLKFTAISAFGNNLYIDNVKIEPAPPAGFALLSPADSATVLVAGPAQLPINITWQKAGSLTNPSYSWLLKTLAGTFNNPIASILSNNNGADTTLTLTIAQVDALLAANGVAIGDTANLEWTVRAVAGNDTVFATKPFFIRLVRLGVATPNFLAAPQNNGATTQLRAPNGTATHNYMRAAMIIRQNEFLNAGIDSNTILRGMGFTLSTPTSASVTGLFKVYVQNTTDVNYNKGTAWSGILTGMTLVYDDTLVIPANQTLFDILFSNNSNFVYTGQNLYLAYDWQMLSAPAPTPFTYLSNNTIPSSLVSAQATNPPAPTTLGSTAFRPEIRWAVDKKPNDLEVRAIWALGKNATPWGKPETVQAVIVNNGYLPQNKNVTLTVTGANTATITAGVNLQSGQSTVVSFSYPNNNLGFSTLTVSVPSDDVPSNNQRSYVQDLTTDRFSYADTTVTGLSGVGFNTGSGLLLTRYSVNGTRSVSGVRVRLSNNAAAIGQTIYPVLLKDTVIVAQGPNYVITAADTSSYKTFNFPTPFTFTNEDFYVGIAQTVGSQGYFPLAFQNENPTRPNAYYSAALNGSGLTTVNNFRLMIEAILNAPDSLTPFSLATPANNSTYNAVGPGSVTITWQKSQRAIGTAPAVTYEWMVDVPTGNFTNPIATFPSNNNGLDTFLILTNAQINALLAANNVPPGTPADVKWTVRATSGTLNRFANQPFNITLIGAIPCTTPSAVNVTPACNSATVTWTSGTGKLSSKIEYGPTGFTPGSGTVVSGITANTFTITGLTPGTGYEVIVTDSCASGLSSPAPKVGFTTDPNPVAAFTAGTPTITATNATVTFDASTSQNAVSYNWDFGNGTQGTGVNPTATYTANGTYTVKLVVTNACGSDSTTSTITIQGINLNENLLNAITLYPNPTNGIVTLKGIEILTNAEISVVDISGKLVLRRKLDNVASQEVLDLSKFAAGSYQIRITSNEGTVVKPVVLNK